jgi:hypothetical protein
MEHGLVWLQDGEYERSQASHEKLRSDYEDVVNALARTWKDVRVSSLKGGGDDGRRTKMIPAFALRLPRSDLAPPFWTMFSPRSAISTQLRRA